MPSLSPMPEPQGGLEVEQVFSISLTVYSKVKKIYRGKAASKEEKTTKTKELLFATKSSNYVEFLQSMLEKHGQEEYEVTTKRHYPFKYTLPKIKGQRVADAIDVDNAADYEEMVTKINESKPLVIKILLDMRDIQKLPRVHSSSESAASEASPKADKSATKTDLDSRLGRWRIMLQQKYKNEHDNGLTYVGPFGPMPLTGPMILDWARALEAGQATLHEPPNIDSFNPANKAPILHANRRPQLPPSLPSPTPAVDLNSLTSILLIQAMTKSGLFPSESTASPDAITSAGPSMPLPQTPTRQQKSAPTSELIPSPSHLARYLEYAKTHLGVRHALAYQTSLELNGIGPDILPDVDDKFLASLGISAGDVIRLKNGSTAWWNGPDAKRKRSDTVASDGRSQADEEPPKKVFYKKKFHNGGGATFSGLPMRADNGPDESLDRDYDLFYFCETQKQWLPVPRGFSVDVDEEPPQFGFI